MCDRCNGLCDSCNCNCNEPCLTPDCACKVFITTDCVTMSEDLPCSNISKGQTETEVLKQLDAYICQRFTSAENFLQLVNVGNGAGIYKGVSVLGKKELKSLVSDGTVIITENENTINFSVNPTGLQDLQSVLNTGNIATLGSTDFSFLPTGFKSEHNGSTGNDIIASNIVQNQAIVALSASVNDDINGDGDGYNGGIVIDNGQIHFLHEKVIAGQARFTDIKFTDPIESTTLFFPAKLAGDYTIATIDDINNAQTNIVDGNNTTVIGDGSIGSPFQINIDGSETKLISGTNNTVSGNGTIATPYQISVPIPDGSETKINSGTNISITGNGTTGTPYSINNTLVIDGTETKVTAGTNVTVTGNGSISTPYVINSTASGSTLEIDSGITTTVTGDGSLGTPYVIETVNLQKPITADYTVLSSDNNYSIKINNGATPITITVPSGLPENFFAGFTQKGSGDVTFLGSSATIGNPVGLKIKGQGYHVGLEQIGTTNSFDLLGATKS